MTIKLEQKRKKFAWVGFEETVNSVTDAILPTNLLIEESNNHVKHLFKKNVNNQTQLRKPKKK